MSGVARCPYCGTRGGPPSAQAPCATCAWPTFGRFWMDEDEAARHNSTVLREEWRRIVGGAKEATPAELLPPPLTYESMFESMHSFHAEEAMGERLERLRAEDRAARSLVRLDRVNDLVEEWERQPWTRDVTVASRRFIEPVPRSLAEHREASSSLLSRAGLARPLTLDLLEQVDALILAHRGSDTLDLACEFSEPDPKAFEGLDVQLRGMRASLFSESPLVAAAIAGARQRERDSMRSSFDVDLGVGPDGLPLEVQSIASLLRSTTARLRGHVDDMMLAAIREADSEGAPSELGEDEYEHFESPAPTSQGSLDAFAKRTFEEKERQRREVGT